MNITELARRLKISTQQLKEELPKLGFDIGFRAIKIDDRAAQKVIRLWSERKAGPSQNQYVVVEKKLGVSESGKAKEVAIPKILTTRELADLLGLPVTTVIGELFKNGVMASINERIDFETASIIAQDLGFITQPLIEQSNEFKIENTNAADLEEILKADLDKKISCPPVVVVMGHVDHGKTKLLDAIRETNVAEQESGAITQHIGAYQVEVKSKDSLKSQDGETNKETPRLARDDSTLKARSITFLDTPGHEAFSAMRSRGGRLADIAIIVIAADDGIKPQTLEALEIVQKESIPFLIAINKIDKPEADIDKLKKSLAELNLLPEDWGGKTICALISAKKKIGLNELLDMVLLLADLEKVSANPNRAAVGTIIEAHIDKGEGPVVTALVQAGTLRCGDYLVAGQEAAGKVRAMKNFLGKNISEALPATPVKILGLKVSPVVGDIFKVVDKNIARSTLRKACGYSRFTNLPTVLEKPADDQSDKKQVPTLPIIIKTDVLGSREAIISSLQKLSTPEVQVVITKSGLGNINETDIATAEAVGAIVLGFHVQILPPTQALAKDKQIFTATYQVIYDLLDEVKKRLDSLLKPELIRSQIGQGKVLAIFRKGKKDTIIGVRVLKGLIKPDTKIKLVTTNNQAVEAMIEEVRLGKEVVSEVSEGGECGIKLKGEVAVNIGDNLEIYHEEIRRRHIA